MPYTPTLTGRSACNWNWEIIERINMAHRLLADIQSEEVNSALTIYTRLGDVLSTLWEARAWAQKVEDLHRDADSDHSLRRINLEVIEALALAHNQLTGMMETGESNVLRLHGGMARAMATLWHGRTVAQEAENIYREAASRLD